MQAVINFIQTYWTYISAGILILIEVLILILKKRPKSIDDFKSCLDQVINLVPHLILDAEHPGDGEKKKELVVAYALAMFKKLLNRDITDSEYHIVKEAVQEQVELILSTPQKKGAKDGEKKSSSI